MNKRSSRRKLPVVKIEQRLGEAMQASLVVNPTKRLYILWFKDHGTELEIFFPEKCLWMFEAMLKGAAESMKGARKAARRAKTNRTPKSTSASKTKRVPKKK